MPLSKLKPASVNDAIYKPVDPQDPQVRELARKIRRQGLLEPIVITTDNVIPRHAAGQEMIDNGRV